MAVPKIERMLMYRSAGMSSGLSKVSEVKKSLNTRTIKAGIIIKT